MSLHSIDKSSQPARRPESSLVQQVLSVPNQLTMLRMLVLPFILIAMIYERHDLALALFLAAALTDGIDGIVARRFNQRTLLGEFLDPIADKLLLSSCFIVQSLTGALPWWITILVLSRDVIIVATVLVVVLATGVRRFPPSGVGKANTAVQIATVFGVLVHNYLGTAWTAWVVDALVCVAAATILLSAVHYALETSRRLQQHHSADPGG